MPPKPEIRAVTRSVIDSAIGPSAIYEWPKVQSEVAKQLLDQLVSLLTPLGQHRTHASHLPRRAKRRKVTVSAPPIERPESVKQLESACRIGFNACTNHLARQAAHLQDSSMHSEASTHADTPQDTIKTLFVCREDVGPSLLYDHLPGLAHSASSHRDADDTNAVRIVQLPKGSEVILGKSLALPRVTMLALLDSDLEAIKGLNKEVATHVSPAASSFAIPPKSEYRVLKIKTIHTTAPLQSNKASAPHVDTNTIAVTQ